MTSKKFEKKIDKASDKKLVEMYFDRFDHNPNTREVEELRVLSGKLPDTMLESMRYLYYEAQMAKLNKTKFRLLTGYGQCKGDLIVHNGQVVICCCREMAQLVAFKNAFHSKGRIRIPGERGNATNHEGSVFIISDDMGMSFRKCPFCDAHIIEKLDFDNPSHNEDEDDDE